MGYCEQDLASLLENMQTPFSEAQVKAGLSFSSIVPRGCCRSSQNVLATSVRSLDLQRGWGALGGLGRGVGPGLGWHTKCSRDLPGWV